jgi:hypothetical protein
MDEVGPGWRQGRWLGFAPLLLASGPSDFSMKKPLSKPLAKCGATRFTRLVSALGSAIATAACPYQRLAQGGHQPRQRHLRVVESPSGN